MSKNKSIYQGIIFTIRQILGALASVGIWYIDVEHILTNHSFPIMVYLIPIGIALGWDVQKLITVLSKGTKFEGMFEEKKEAIEIPSDILSLAVVNNINLNVVRNALETGICPKDLKKLISENPDNLENLYGKKT